MCGGDDRLGVGMVKLAIQSCSFRGAQTADQSQSEKLGSGLSDEGETSGDAR